MRGVRKAALAALMLALLWLPGRAATAVPDRFVVPNFRFARANPGAVLRFDASGAQDSAPFLSGDTLNVAWGPDGLLYRVNFSGGVDAFDPDSGALTPFVTQPANPGGNGLVFGPDGNLYVGTSKSIDRYCGPRSLTCVPGFRAGFDSHVFGGTDARYSSQRGLTDMVFGPDGNLYVEGGGTVVRICGPQNPRCTPGDQLPGASADAGTTGGIVEPFLWLPNGEFFGGIAFGPDGNLYLTHTWIQGDRPAANILRFCGGPDNGSSCQMTPALLTPSVGETVVSFPPGTTSPTGLDFGPNGELYVLASNGVQRFFLSNCATGSCEVSPHPAAGLNGATLVPPGTAGLSVPTYLKFPHSFSRVAPPP